MEYTTLNWTFRKKKRRGKMKINQFIGKTKIKAKKYSPEMLMIIGIAGVITSTVMACKASTKVNDIKEEKNKKLEEVKSKYNLPDSGTNTKEEITNEKKKEITKVYVETGVEFVKLYGPSVALGVLSITSILTSNKIIKRRNVALAAAYKAVDSSFKEYRERVVERFGKELDRELKYGIRKETIETVTTDEKGKEKKKKEIIDVIDGTEISEFAKFFDASCDPWEKNPEYNLSFLTMQQSIANDKLKRQGYLFLNEVYEMLDIPKTKAGQIVGWVYNEEVPNGDNYVDFGIYEIHRTANRNFVNGIEPVVLLDFNVDGDILDLMG